MSYPPMPTQLPSGAPISSNKSPAQLPSPAELVQFRAMFTVFSVPMAGALNDWLALPARVTLAVRSVAQSQGKPGGGNTQDPSSKRASSKSCRLRDRCSPCNFGLHLHTRHTHQPPHKSHRPGWRLGCNCMHLGPCTRKHHTRFQWPHSFHDKTRWH